MNQKQKAEEFYAKKIGKTIAEFDEYDKFVCLVASEFHQSLVNDELKDLLIWLSNEPKFNISQKDIKEIIEDYTYFKKSNHN